jgi:hypothetical protein
MEKKYVIYRILVIGKDGKRESFNVHDPTDDLEQSRKEFKNIFPDASRIYLSYNEKED